MAADTGYRALLDRLYAARRFGVVLGLDRMRAILAKLGDPHRELGAIVHVGGTNGKGSTSAMIAAIAAAHGAKVGLYTSPHLTSVRERITCDGQPISRAAFVAAAARVEAVGGAELTFFEQLTAIAMVALRQHAPDVTVLEVGLGGRLDATNVVDSAVAVVTGVALDHEAILGATLPQIAFEKAGIFRRDRPAIIGASGEPTATAALVGHAVAMGARPCVVIDEAAAQSVPQPALLGGHQRRNAAAAVAAIEQLVAAAVLPADSSAVARGLAAVRHPGRLEVVDGRPVVVLDGAHNPHGAAALAEALRGWPAPRVLVFAVSADKDVPAMLAALAPSVTSIVATAYAQDRAMPPPVLAEHVARLWPGHVACGAASARSLAEALALARPLAGEAGTIVVAGSLFLVGEARALLLGADSDEVPLSDPVRT